MGSGTGVVRPETRVAELAELAALKTLTDLSVVLVEMEARELVREWRGRGRAVVADVLVCLG